MIRLLRAVLSALACPHARTTWPRASWRDPALRRRVGGAANYVACLDCGAEIAYDWRRMKQVSGARCQVSGKNKHAEPTAFARREE